MNLRFRRAPPGGSKSARLHDPPALAAGFRSSPIFFVSRNGGPHTGYSFFSRSCSINAECAGDPTRHLTAVHSVRPDTGPVRRVRDLEWRYCTRYVLRRVQPVSKSLVLA